MPCELFGVPVPLYIADGETSVHSPLTTCNIFPLSVDDTAGRPLGIIGLFNIYEFDVESVSFQSDYTL